MRLMVPVGAMQVTQRFLPLEALCPSSWMKHMTC